MIIINLYSAIKPWMQRRSLYILMRVSAIDLDIESPYTRRTAFRISIQFCIAREFLRVDLADFEKKLEKKHAVLYFVLSLNASSDLLEFSIKIK